MNIKNSVVAILNDKARVVGTGFLASRNLVVTCAHVVVAADAIDGDTVQVRFEGRTEKLNALVVPEYWRDIDKGDVAILRLENVPDGFHPLPLGNAAGSAGHNFYAYGYATVTDVQGIGARGKIVDIVDNGRLVQLNSQEPDHGMSGGPVLDEQRRVVIGMVTKGKGLLEKDQNLRNTQTSFATSVEVIREVCPELRLTEICPYRSLDVFNEEDAPFFFGREKVVQKLIDSLKREPRFLAVLGPSGSGKSSVVRAGLIPALRQGKVSGSQKWEIVTIRPSSNPFEQLTGIGFTRPQDGLENAVRAWLAGHPGRSKLVIVIDQFEEVLVATPQDIRQEFITALAQLLDSPGDIAIILTLRDDFYSMFLQECTKIASWLERGLVNIPVTLEEDELRSIMIEPAKNEGLEFEDGLANVILEAVTGTSQTEKVVRNTILPLLEFTLTQLWENRIDGRLTHAAYKSLGGVSGGLAQWANKAHYTFNDADRKRSRNIFCSLVYLGNPEGGIPDSRRQCAFVDLSPNPAERANIRQVVNALADARLIITGQNMQKQEVVDLIHDSLLTQWMQLQKWIGEDRKFLIWKQRIDERIQEWENKSGDLLRGNALLNAKEFLEQYGDRLDERIVAYINESVAKEEQVLQRIRSAEQVIPESIHVGITDLEFSIQRIDGDLLADRDRSTVEMSYSAPGVEITETASAHFEFDELDSTQFDMNDYSRALSQMFFADPKIRVLFVQAYENAIALGADLRLRFRIQDSRLYNQYWETLRHPLTGEILGENENILISRYQTSRNWKPVRLNSRANLKALIMVSNPHNLDLYKLSPLDTKLEIEIARRGLGNIPCINLEKATPDALFSALQENTPDILYIVSHSYYHPERGTVLFLEDNDGKVKPVLGAELAARMMELSSLPTLVVSSSTQNSDKKSYGVNTFGPLLIQAGVPAVLSMLGRISLQTLHTFAPVFFANLQADGYVDRALTVARGSIRERPDAWEPILLMRLKNGKIFV